MVISVLKGQVDVFVDKREKQNFITFGQVDKRQSRWITHMVYNSMVLRHTSLKPTKIGGIIHEIIEVQPIVDPIVAAVLDHRRTLTIKQVITSSWNNGITTRAKQDITQLKSEQFNVHLHIHKNLVNVSS